jgi:hypothetical protein
MFRQIIVWILFFVIHKQAQSDLFCDFGVLNRSNNLNFFSKFMHILFKQYDKYVNINQEIGILSINTQTKHVYYSNQDFFFTSVSPILLLKLPLTLFDGFGNYQ